MQLRKLRVFAILFGAGVLWIGVIGNWVLRMANMDNLILMPHPVIDGIVSFLAVALFVVAPTYVLWIAFKQRKMN